MLHLKKIFSGTKRHFFQYSKGLSCTFHFIDHCLEGLVSSVKDTTGQNLEALAHNILALKLYSSA